MKNTTIGWIYHEDIVKHSSWHNVHSSLGVNDLCKLLPATRVNHAVHIILTSMAFLEKTRIQWYSTRTVIFTRIGNTPLWFDKSRDTYNLNHDYFFMYSTEIDENDNWNWWCFVWYMEHSTYQVYGIFIS
jgi:hypothetical protein